MTEQAAHKSRLPRPGCMAGVALALMAVAWAFSIGLEFYRILKLEDEIEAMGGFAFVVGDAPQKLKERGITFPKMEWINLAEVDGVTDEWLARLGGLDGLEKLYLEQTQITDDGMRHLAGLTDLTVLFLDDTRIGDEGLMHLRRLPKLKRLSVTGTLISDTGLAHLSEMPQLEVLFLSDTRVGDDGVQHLIRLRNLKSVALIRTGVTSRGVAVLQHRFPECFIAHESLPPNYLDETLASDLAFLSTDDWEFDASDGSSTDAADSRAEGLVRHVFLSGGAAALLDVESSAVLSEFWSAVLASDVQEAMQLIAIPYAGGQLKESVLADDLAGVEEELTKSISRVSTAGDVRAVIWNVRRHEDVRELLIETDRQHFEAIMDATDLVVAVDLEREDGTPAGRVLTLVSSRSGKPRIVGVLKFEPFK